MLIELKIKNFRSFRDEVTFSMVASPDKSLPNNIFSTPTFGKRNLLRSSVIYGANASGKSNLVSAVYFIFKFITESMNKDLNVPIPITPFLLMSEENNEPSEFEITFIDDKNVRYQYGFQVTTKKVEREWLIAYPKGLPQTWFERFQDSENKNNWFFGKKLKGKNNQIAELTRPDILFLSNAAKLNHQQLGHVFNWIQNNVRVIATDEIKPFFSDYSAALAKNNDQIQSRIRNLLAVADFGISDFEVAEEIYTEKDLPADMPEELRTLIVNKKHLSVYMQHLLEAGKKVSFPIQEESNGTQRLFALSGPLDEALQNGWILIIDELDASLHPLLVRSLVELFHNPLINPKGAQLIFNTHDTTLMDCDLFRRDQIWFVEKDHQGSSHLYPLLDYSPRKDEALAKGYLLGRYGAIPFLSEPQWREA